MKKNILMKHLENDIYCRIGISKIDKNGVGVIAIKNIPEGINPFNTLSKCKEDIIILNKKDLHKVDKNVKKLIKDFFGIREYYIISKSPNDMNISYYMNHSDNPNIEIISDNNKYIITTKRFIKIGEELTVNYGELYNNIK